MRENRRTRGSRVTPVATSLVLAGLLIGLADDASGQQAPPNIVRTPVAGGVSMIHMGRPDGSVIGANSVVVQSDSGTILIDSNLPVSPLTALLRRYVENVQPDGLRWVVITHWHPDHSGGIAGFTADIPVIAQTNVKRRLSVETEGVDLVAPGSRFVSPPRSPDGLPTRTVEDSMTWNLGRETMTVVHYPGSHTDGDLAIFLREADVVAMGDLFWPGQFPSIDIVNGGSALGLLHSLEAILARTSPNTRYIPGHGEVAGRAQLEQTVTMMRETIADVRGRVSKGETLEQLQATGLQGDWSAWATRLVPEDQWINLIYQSLRT